MALLVCARSGEVEARILTRNCSWDEFSNTTVQSNPIAVPNEPGGRAYLAQLRVPQLTLLASSHHYLECALRPVIYLLLTHMQSPLRRPTTLSISSSVAMVIWGWCSAMSWLHY